MLNSLFNRKRRNYFLHPRLYDQEFLISPQRRNDLLYLIEKLVARKDRETMVFLDFGGGTAPYRSLFEQRGISYTNADVQKSADLYIGDDQRLDLPDESVDIVLSLRVLEHVEDVKSYLAEARRVMKPGELCG